MSRTAATLLGLTLVALSIGFNTVRYPVVWQMAGPAQPNEPAQAVAALPSEPVTLPSFVGQADATVNSAPAGKIADDRSATAEADSRGNADSAAGTGSSDGPETQRPLVPVTPPSGTELAASVRRLPPVDRANPNGMSRGNNTFGGPIPVYPRTGI